MTSVPKRQCMHLCFCIAFATPFAHAAQDDAAHATEGDVAARFGDRLADGLPATLSIHHRPTEGGGALAGSLTIARRLPVDVDFGDGRHGVMYVGTLDGRDVVATDAGDHIDIRDGERETRRIVDVETPSSTRVKRATDGTDDRRVLDVHFFLHQTLNTRFTTDAVHDDYVAWWLKDIGSILPSMRIVVHYHMSGRPIWNTPTYFTELRGIVGLDLRNAKNLEIFEKAAERWIQDLGNPRDAHLQKFVLLTGGTLPNGRYGTAFRKGSTAIASLDGPYRIVAHALGHLLGADDDDGAVLYREGWWCESNMYPASFGLRSNCYVYTKENARRIRHYAIVGPEGTFHEPVVIDG